MVRDKKGALLMLKAIIVGAAAFWITYKMTASKPQTPAVPDQPQ